jgi:SAM-dependent methyltransferase
VSHVDELKSQLTSLLSQVIEQKSDKIDGQLMNISDSISYLLGRVEFVRRELMFEMQYGDSLPSTEKEKLKAQPEIRSPEKLAIARRKQVKLNLGCGHIPLKDYLNIDRRALPGVDIVAEADDLPFEEGEVDEIFSTHLLEHFPQEQLRRKVLRHWFGLLKNGGEFRAVVPDALSMIKGYVQGSYPYTALREVTFGSQDYVGDFHFNMFVPDQLQELLNDAGFRDFELIEQGRRNGECFEMEVRAFKPT